MYMIHSSTCQGIRCFELISYDFRWLIILPFMTGRLDNSITSKWEVYQSPTHNDCCCASIIQNSSKLLKPPPEDAPLTHQPCPSLLNFFPSQTRESYLTMMEFGWEDMVSAYFLFFTGCKQENGSEVQRFQAQNIDNYVDMLAELAVEWFIKNHQSPIASELLWFTECVNQFPLNVSPPKHDIL